ncbi:MAG: ABC transporter permease [Gemmatimonadales bacterium]|nr:ABC transporter permease [Gemmatimonadales bacterium]
MQWLVTGFRHALRSIGRSRRFTLLFVAVMSPVVAVTTVVLSIVRATTQQAASYRDPASIAVVMGATEPRCGPDCPDLFDGTTLERLARDETLGPLLIPVGIRQLAWHADGGVRPLSGAIVPSRINSVLSAPTHLGRQLLPADDGPGATPVALLSFTSWRRHFGSAAEVVGQQILLDDRSYRVIGVLRAGAEYPTGTDVIINGHESTGHVSSALLTGLVRLNEDLTLDQLRARLAAIAADRWPSSMPEGERRGLTALSLLGQLEGSNGGLVRLAGTVNLAILTLLAATLQLMSIGRAMRRAPELAVMAALGASRRRVLTLGVLEQVVLATLASTAGIIVGWWALDWIEPLLRSRIGLLVDLRVDWAVAGLTAAGGIAVATAGGLAGLLSVGHVDLRSGFADGGATTVGRRRRTLQGALIVAQLAVTVLLAASAGSLAQSLARVRQLDLRFATDDLVIASLQARYGGERPIAELFLAARDIEERLAAMPGLRDATVWFAASPNLLVPLGDPYATVEGREARLTANTAPLRITGVLPGFVRTIGLHLIQGRDLTADDRADSESVALITESAAATWWPGVNPLGRRFKIGGEQSPYPWLTVVGVIADLHPIQDSGPRLAAQLPPGRFYPLAFVPLSQFASHDARRSPFEDDLTVALRRRPLDAPTRTAIADAIETAAPQFAVERVQRFDELAMAEWSMIRLRFNLHALQWIAILGVILALASVAGVVTETVAMRYRELSLRLALGASPAGLVRSVMADMLRVGAVAGIIGVTATLALTRILGALFFGPRNSFLFGIEPYQPAILAGVVGGVLALMTAVAYTAARPIARIDAIRALTSER